MAYVGRTSAARWNSWIRSESSEIVKDGLQPGQDYDVHFDLSAIDYSRYFEDESVTAAVGEQFRRELDRIPGASMRILVQAVVVGAGLRLLPASGARAEFTVNLLRLRDPAMVRVIPAAAGGPFEMARRTSSPPSAADRSARTLTELSSRVNALQPELVVGVHAEAAGCAAVAVSIWNASLSMPIDHVVRRIAVGSSRACQSPAISGRAIETGLLSLLALPYDRAADAALHVFEIELTSQQTATAAVFVRNGSPPEVSSWNPARQLSTYLGGSGGGQLRAELEEARRCSQSDPRASCYSGLSQRLTSVVFSDATGERQKDADRALKALQELSARRQAPNVFFRLVDAQGRTTLLPLGLLGLGNGERLARKINAIMPMPHERPVDPGRCVAGWELVLPEAMDEVEAEFLAPLGAEPKTWIRTWKPFEEYATAAGDENGPRGEGLLLLAHHGGGKLAFFPRTRTEALVPEQLRRRFPPGSVAVLAACGVGRIGEDNAGLPLLDRLNRLGIDAAILSPFDVRAPLGARFAIHFAREIERADQGKATIDLLELFRRSRDAVREDALARDFADELDEFLLVGNSRIPLCHAAPS